MDNTEPMPLGLTDEDLQEFIAIYKKGFGTKLPPAEARGIAILLLELYAQLAKPLPSEKPSVSKNCSLIREDVPEFNTVFPIGPVTAASRPLN